MGVAGAKGLVIDTFGWQAASTARRQREDVWYSVDEAKHISG